MLSSSSSSSSESSDDESTDLAMRDYRSMRNRNIRMKTKTPKDGISFKHVKDPSYPSHLSSGLNKLRQQASFCDVSIIVGGQRFSAHKAVLSCACDYFQGMFSSGFQESVKNEITIPGAPESFAKLLEFAYTGCFILSPATILDVLKMASYMLFTSAMDAFAKYLMDVKGQLSMGDCFEV